MPIHSHPLYESKEAVPEVIPHELWLPAESRVRIPQASNHASFTTTPREVGFAFYQLRAGGFSAERSLIDLHLIDGGLPQGFLEDNWGNHVGRVMLKAALDPDRLAPIDLVHAYRQETKVRGQNAGEELFFAGFLDTWGVIDRA